MMKKFFTFILLFSAMMSMTIAQTIVGTDPENKNVVLEEFTGIHCVFCPEGHAIGQAIYDAHPDDVVLINIHQGSYAVPSAGEPDYRTPWGNAIAGQTALIGYPAGTVNRHLFSGWSQSNGTAMSRSYWTAASNQILATPSYLNVGAEATIVTSTRQLVVEVEVYYTDNSPAPSNLLNIAILQNNILGPQVGGNMGDQYPHKHMLRDLITGQWGVEVDQTTTGSLYSGVFTYDIPLDYTDVGVVLEDLDIAAFVTETHQEVISGNLADITFIESNDYDASVVKAYYPVTACAGTMAPTVVLKNYGVQELTNVTFTYSINGGDVATYEWTGSLQQLESTIVELPEIVYDVLDNNTLVVSCNNPDGQTDQLPQNDMITSSFTKSQYFPQNGYFGVQTLGNQEDITWSIVDSQGTIIAEGGPYSTQGLHLEPISFPDNGCYSLTLNDASGEGLSGGFYLITDENTEVLWTGPAFTDKVVAELAYDESVGLSENNDLSSVSIYPNPISESANIELDVVSKANSSIDLIDVLGRKVAEVYQGILESGQHKFTIKASGLDKGMYFVRIQLGDESTTRKVVIE